MANDTFDYENLGDAFQAPNFEDYVCFQNRSGLYHTLIMKDAYRDRLITNGEIIEHELENGWKFHISIDDQDQTNITAGWNIVKNILIDNAVYTFKVVSPGKHAAEHMVDEISQEGKQIVIYSYCQPNKNWGAILQQIEEALISANIRPSTCPIDDKAVEGSRYIGYRHDGGARGAGYNPDGLEDIYGNIRISTREMNNGNNCCLAS